MDYRVITAWGPWKMFLERFGIAAITMPWKRIYVLERYSFNYELLLHEGVHLEQIDRDGPVKFTIKYLYWLWKYGYYHNPYEVEAYSKAPLN